MAAIWERMPLTLCRYTWIPRSSRSLATEVTEVPSTRPEPVDDSVMVEMAGSDAAALEARWSASAIVVAESAAGAVADSADVVVEPAAGGVVEELVGGDAEVPVVDWLEAGGRALVCVE